MMNLQEVEILLIEDSKTDADLAILTLEDYNLANKVVLLRDGKQALEYLFKSYKNVDTNSSSPGLILLDLKMPRVGGIEVLRAIREDPQLRHIPVVVLTSSNEEKDVVESYKLGVNSYIIKPIDIEQLSSSIMDIGYSWTLFNE